MTLSNVPLWPLVAFSAASVVMGGGMLALSYVLGQRHRDRLTGQPYESGIAPTESARLRIPIRYYLVAILFLVFDVEAVLLFGWAVAAAELGWGGYAAAATFMLLLLLALAYLWRQGALDWSGESTLRAIDKRHIPAQDSLAPASQSAPAAATRRQPDKESL